jgi:hypothetical protein
MATAPQANAGGDLHAARHFQQMAGVFGSAGAGMQNQIVGGSLTLFQELTPGDPGERIPPVQNQRQARDQMRGHIASADVGQLMQQYHASPFFGPRFGIARHEDGRPQDAAGHRHGSLLSFKHVYGVRDSKFACQLRGEGAIH